VQTMDNTSQGQLKTFVAPSQVELFRAICGFVGIQTEHGSEERRFLVHCESGKGSQVAQQLAETFNEEEFPVLDSKEPMPDGFVIAVRESGHQWPQGPGPIKKGDLRKAIGDGPALFLGFELQDAHPRLAACAILSTDDGPQFRGAVLKLF